MRRRVRDEEAVWPPENLRHFRLDDWPGLTHPSAKPPIEECAGCAWEDARSAWLLSRAEDLDPVIHCCPDHANAWTCDKSKPFTYHWHEEWI